MEAVELTYFGCSQPRPRSDNLRPPQMTSRLKRKLDDVQPSSNMNESFCQVSGNELVTRPPSFPLETKLTISSSFFLSYTHALLARADWHPSSSSRQHQEG